MSKASIRLLCGALLAALLCGLFGGCGAVFPKYVDHLNDGCSGIARQVGPEEEKDVLRPSFAEGADGETILELGRCPGPGLRELHACGIDGSGVSIGIIGEPLYTGHEEYADNLVLYEELHVRENAGAADRASWSASTAVGKTCGVAPGASLYYIAVDQRKSHTEQYAAAILRLLEINKQLPKEQKIKAIAICEYVTYEAACDEYEEAIRQAMAADIFVITPWNEVTTRIYLISYFGTYGPDKVTRTDPLSDPEDPESYSPYHPGHNDTQMYHQVHQLFFPLGARTFASADGGYAFFQSGALYMEPAYLAGLYAIAAQIYAVEELPEDTHSLTPEYFYEVIDHTAEVLVRELPDYSGIVTKSSNYMLNAREFADALWQEARGSDTTWRSDDP